MTLNHELTKDTPHLPLINVVCGVDSEYCGQKPSYNGLHLTWQLRVTLHVNLPKSTQQVYWTYHRFALRLQFDLLAIHDL